MGNRRLTLAVPPFAVSPMKSIGPGDLQDPGACSGGHQSSVRKTPPLSVSNVRANPLDLEIDLQEWLNSDHFPPLSSRRNITKGAFGLPKHPQPCDATVVQRLQNQHLPPIAAVDSNSIVVGNLPLHFSWSSNVVGANSECRRSVDQIIKELHSPNLYEDERLKQSSNPPLPKQSCAAVVGGRKEMTSAEKAKLVFGPAHTLDPCIEDLFAHSYSPPTKPKPPQPQSSRWFWVEAATVWDPVAEHFPASASDIQKLGERAKHLRRVTPTFTDGRAFVEVARKTMDKKLP